MNYKNVFVWAVKAQLLFGCICFGDTYWKADVFSGALWSDSGNWTAGLPDTDDRANFVNTQALTYDVNVDVEASIKKILITQNYTFGGIGRVILEPAATAHWDKALEVNSASVSVVFNSKVTLNGTTDYVSDIRNSGSIVFNEELELKNSYSRPVNFSGTGSVDINGDLINSAGMRFGSSGMTVAIGGNGQTSGRGGVTLLSGVLELNRAAALVNSSIKMEGVTLVLGAENAIEAGADIDFRSGTIKAAGFDQQFGTLDVDSSDVVLDMGASDAVFTFADSSGAGWGSGRLIVTNSSQSVIRFAVNSAAGTLGLLDEQISQISIEGKTLSEADVLLEGDHLYIARPEQLTVGEDTVPPVYVGFYRGAEMAEGLYKFTDLTDPVGTSTRIGTWPFPDPTYDCVGFDGESYFIFNRGTSFGGPGLHQYDGMTSLPQISESQAYSDWHGVGTCNDVYYGLYGGTGLKGAGLYIFMDPADPGNTCVRLFEDQAFSSDLWTDVAFDGERYLFVRNDSDGGTPGIYQYDSLTDEFTLISGSETYSDWQGLGVFDADIAPLRNKKAYVLLFGGQSNALGWGYRQYLLDTGDRLAFPQSDVDMLYSIAGTGYLPEDVLLPLQSGNSNTNVKELPNHYPELTVAPISRFGPELNFARRVRDLITFPDSKIGVVKFAHGGTSLYDTADWRPDGTASRSADGNLYQIFQRTAWRGIAAMKNKYPYHSVEVLGMGWVQGESDALEGEGEEYEENLTRLVADVRATFGANLTFVLSKISLNQIEGTSDTNKLVQWPIVMDAQDAVAAADPKVVATETAGADYAVSTGLAEGQYHYTTESLLRIGDDLAQALVSVCGVDSDNDGILDSWENSYEPGTAGLGASADADYDEDGLTDLEEFRVGSDPTDSSDRFELSVDSSFQGHWPASRDVVYKVMQSSNLLSWTEIGDPVLFRNTNGMAEFDIAEYAQAGPSGFFRVVVD